MTYTTVGSQIRNSATIKAALDSVVQEVTERASTITETRGPESSLAADYDALCKAAGDSRGRPLLYKYLGSGAGNGALVELADGSVKWDLVTGIGVHFFGHSNPEVVRAQLEAGLEDTTKHGNLQSGDVPYEFAQKLVALASRKSNLKYAFLTTSGAMANECALKVCMQKHSPADRVIAFNDCFMGRSLTMTSIGDSAGPRDGIPINQAVDYMPFYNPIDAEAVGIKTYIDGACEHLQMLIDRYPRRHAVFVMELVQGEGGFNTPKRDFLVELMKICKENKVAVWDDEIQSFGRTTEMFAFEAFDVGEYVDVFCVGKMLQGCATMFTEEYNPRPGLLSGTFLGATTDFKVGLRFLEMLEAGPEGGSFYGEDGHFAQHHAAFTAQVEALVSKHPSWFPSNDRVKAFSGGIGGMMRMTPFGGEKAKVVAAAKALYEEGAIMFWCGHGPYHLRMLPPLPMMSVDQWPTIFEVIERGLAKAAG